MVSNYWKIGTIFLFECLTILTYIHIYSLDKNDNIQERQAQEIK